MQEPLRPNDKRATIAIVVIGIISVFSLVSLALNFLEYNRIVLRGTYFQIQLVLFCVSTALNLISAITFIQWFRRAYYNLHTLSYNLRFSEGWAAGAWFVPVLLLFRPCQIMTELYRETDRILTEGDKDYIPKNGKLGLVAAWWILWLLYNIVNNFTPQPFLESDTITDPDSVLMANVFLNFLNIPLGLITMRVIYVYSKMEQMLYEMKLQSATIDSPNQQW